MNRLRKAKSPKRVGLPRIRTFEEPRLAHEHLALMRAMAQRRLRIRQDALDEAALREYETRGDVTLAGARHARSSADHLVDAGLAAWRPGQPSIIALTDEGDAYRRRRNAAYEASLHARERDLAQETIDVEGRPETVVRNTAESPLEWLSRRRGKDGAPLVGTAELQAGERLRSDLTIAAILPGVTMAWRQPTSSGNDARSPAETTDAMVAARQRVRAAMEAVGPDYADLLIDLCGFLKGLETLERDRGWPARSAKVVVRLALGSLAVHYGIGDAAKGPERARGIRVWRGGPG
jgi:hypothetical protein